MFIFLYLFILLLGLANSAPVVLKTSEIYLHQYVTCLHSGANYTSECHARSDGCDTETHKCILSTSIGYDEVNPFIDFTVTKYSAITTMIPDGKIGVAVQYSNPGAVFLNGVFQIWQLEHETPEADFYNFTKRQEIIWNNAGDVVVNLLFSGFYPGTYVVVFWDLGGTRFGLGNPETSEPFTLEAVYPFPVDPENVFDLEMIPQACSAYHVGVFDCFCNLPPLNNADTCLSTPEHPHMTYKLTGPLLFEIYFMNAATWHNRRVVFELRSDQGNLLDAEFESYVNDTECGTADYYEYTACNGFNANDPANFCPVLSTSTCDLFKWRIFPMNQGGYQVGSFVFSESRRQLLQVRLAYEGLSGSQWSDFWESAEARQNYGYGTLMTHVIFDQTNKEGPRWNFQGPSGGPNDLGGQYNSMSDDMIMQEDLHTEGTDFFHNEYLPYNSRCDSASCNAGTDEYWEIRGGGQGPNSGELLTFEDYYNDDDIIGGGVVETHGFRLELSYVDHFNTETALDYSCSPLATAYALQKSNPVHYTDNDENDPEAGVTNKYYTYPFADVRFSLRRFDSYKDGCVSDGVDCETDYGSGMENPDHDPQGEQCDCCLGAAASNGDTYTNLCDGNSDVLLELGTSPCELIDHAYIWRWSGRINQEETDPRPDINNIYCSGGVSVDTRHCIKQCFATFRHDDSDVAMATGSAVDPFRQWVEEFNGFNAWETDWGTSENRIIFLVDQENPSSIPTNAQHYQYNPAPRHGLHYGLDSKLVTYRIQAAGSNLRYSFGAMTMMYARYQVFPTFTLLYFEQARMGIDLDPDVIEVVFRVDCPLAELAWPRLTASSDGYCLEIWTILDQNDDNMIVQVLEGGLETGSMYKWGLDDEVTLSAVQTSKLYRIRVKYNSGSTLYAQVFRRPEPEKPYATASNQGVCKPNNADDGVPKLFMFEVPEKSIVFSSLIASAESAFPECEYSPQTISAFGDDGQPFIDAAVVFLDLPQVEDLGTSVRNQFALYWYKWTIDGATIEGFSEQTQIYSPGMTVRIYDRVTSIEVTDIVPVELPPRFPNPLIRAARCLSDQLAKESAVCPINIQEDGDDVSGINQFHFCDMEEEDEDLRTGVVLTPRFVFFDGYTLILNVRAYFFNRTTEFIDVFIDSERIGGLTEQDDFYVVYESGSYTLYVNYGQYVGDVLQAPCYERMLADVYVLRPFTVDPQPLVRINGCVRDDDCCYDQPLIVSGNTPISADVFDLTNSSTYCFDTPPCRWEVIVDPPLEIGAGFCLGITYTLTIQNRESDIANRSVPIIGDPFPFPWRCPATVTIDIPFGGLTPIDTLLTPGTCTNQGTRAEFTLTYEEVTCSGPISTDNVDPNCRYSLWFAIESANPPADINNYVGAPKRTSGPHLITGVYALSFNNPGLFIFPTYFDPEFDAIPNGYWTAYFWITGPTGPTSYASVTDARKKRDTTFIATLKNDLGLTVLRDGPVNRPQCPGPPISIEFIIKDLTWNGPYTALWLTPSGAVISNTTIDEFYVDCTCVFVSESNPCPDCSFIIRDLGARLTVYVGTGESSPGESGAYQLFVYAQGSECGQPYFEIMDELATLSVQIDCIPNTCYGVRDGNVVTDIVGGTVVPFEFRFSLAGDPSGKTGLLYSFNLDTPGGVLHTQSAKNVAEGNYTINVTDYKGCNKSAHCELIPRSPRMRLIPVRGIPPNCTGGLGSIVFTFEGGVGPWFLIRVSNNQIVASGNSYILEDHSVLPGVPVYYAVMDSLGCMSPTVSFNLDPAAVFDLTISTIKFPCDDFTATGIALATTAEGFGTTVDWYYIKTNSHVLTGLLLENALAGAYQVIAHSDLLGCTITKNFDLNAHALPTPQITRIQDPMDETKDIFHMIVSSPNGPVYEFTLFELSTAHPLPFVAQTTTSAIGELTIHNVPVQNTFKVLVADGGGCLFTHLSVGHITPDTIRPIIPTPVANETGPRLKDTNGVNLILAAIIIITFIFFIWMFYIMVIRHSIY